VRVLRCVVKVHPVFSMEVCSTSGNVQCTIP